MEKMTGASDLDLWRRAEQGDAESFGVLFDRHARTVYNFCFRRTADWALAEDLTSTVFLEAWRRRGDVRPEHETLRPWLLGVATNVIRNAARSRRRRDVAEPRAATTGVTPDPADDVAARLDDESSMRRTIVALNSLPPIDRDVLSLFAWGELSYAEIGEVLGIPVGTVRSRLSRARTRLVELTQTSGHMKDGTAEPRAVAQSLRRNSR
jgi:RNA polymerase sigma-70 factor, ECF subfamily